MSVTWIAALSLGFMSSMHCIGMCGPIALALPLNRSSVMSSLGGLLLNNFSRIAGYALLGVPAGLFGKALSIAGFQGYLSVLTGIMMLIMMLGANRYMSTVPVVARYTSKWKTMAAKLFGSSSPYTLSLIGFLNALLPCGFVYIALAGAASTGTAGFASLFMILFGAGTMPALLVVGFAGQLIKPTVRNYVRKLVPVFVSLLACVLILRGLNLGIPYISPVADAHSVQPCCHK